MAAINPAILFSSKVYILYIILMFYACCDVIFDPGLQYNMSGLS